MAQKNKYIKHEKTQYLKVEIENRETHDPVSWHGREVNKVKHVFESTIFLINETRKNKIFESTIIDSNSILNQLSAKMFLFLAFKCLDGPIA